MIEVLQHLEAAFQAVRKYLLEEGYKKIEIVRANPKAKDVSTEFDIGAENAAIDYFRLHKLPVKILTEEQGEIDLSAGEPEFILLIDPVDGSTNLKKGIEGTAFSVACLPCKAGKMYPQNVEHALIGSIISGATVKTSKGKGSFYKGPFSGFEDKRLHTSKNSDLNKAVVEIDLDFGLDEAAGFTKEKKHMNRILPLITQGIKNIRRNGSACMGLSYVATGAVDAYVDVRDISTPENWMAACLLIKEAGGIFTDAFGKEIQDVNMLKPYDYVASGNPEIHKKILELLDIKE